MKTTEESQTELVDNPAINVINARFEQFKKWALEQVESI